MQHHLNEKNTRFLKRGFLRTIQSVSTNVMNWRTQRTAWSKFSESRVIQCHLIFWYFNSNFIAAHITLLHFVYGLEYRIRTPWSVYGRSFKWAGTQNWAVIPYNEFFLAKCCILICEFLRPRDSFLSVYIRIECFTLLCTPLKIKLYLMIIT